MYVYIYVLLQIILSYKLVHGYELLHSYELVEFIHAVSTAVEFDQVSSYL
jgi:hypothetical protein